MTLAASPAPGKRFLSYDELAELMLSRGLLADKSELVQRLQTVNYYRLTGYLASFRKTLTLADGSRVKGEAYRPGTSLGLIWQYYLFDRRLRFLLMAALRMSVRMDITCERLLFCGVWH